MFYNPEIILAFWRDCGLPAAQPEFKFHPSRKWRFDFAFPQSTINHQPSTPLAIEVQGGIWTRGRHTRGSGLVKEHEKHLAMLNTLDGAIQECENFLKMPEYHWGVWGYVWSWGLIIVTTLAQVWYFRRKNWL